MKLELKDSSEHSLGRSDRNIHKINLRNKKPLKLQQNKIDLFTHFSNISNINNSKNDNFDIFSDVKFKNANRFYDKNTIKIPKNKNGIIEKHAYNYNTSPELRKNIQSKVKKKIIEDQINSKMLIDRLDYLNDFKVNSPESNKLIGNFYKDIQRKEKDKTIKDYVNEKETDYGIKKIVNHLKWKNSSDRKSEMDKVFILLKKKDKFYSE